VFENRVIRRIFGTKMEEIAGGWRRLHSEEFLNLYASPNLSTVINLRRTRWEEHVACIGDMRNTYIILVGKPEAKRPLGRPRRR
jgi:hypothetical protein